MKILAHMSLIRWTTWHSSLNNIWVHMSYIVGVLHLCCRFLYLFKKQLSYEAQCGCPATATGHLAAPTCCLSGDQHLQARCRPARAATPPTCTCCLTGKKSSAAAAPPLTCISRPSPRTHRTRGGSCPAKRAAPPPTSSHGNHPHKVSSVAHKKR